MKFKETGQSFRIGVDIGVEGGLLESPRYSMRSGPSPDSVEHVFQIPVGDPEVDYRRSTIKFILWENQHISDSLSGYSQHLFLESRWSYIAKR